MNKYKNKLKRKAGNGQQTKAQKRRDYWKAQREQTERDRKSARRENIYRSLAAMNISKDQALYLTECVNQGRDKVALPRYSVPLTRGWERPVRTEYPESARELLKELYALRHGG